MSNDPSLGMDGWFFDWWNIDTRTDIKRVWISNWLTEMSTIPSSGANWYVVAMLKNGDNYITINRDGKVYTSWWSLAIDLWGTVGNAWEMTTSLWRKWFIILTSWAIKTWDLTTGSNLWVNTATTNITLSGTLDKVFFSTLSDFLIVFSKDKIFVVETSSETWVETEAIDVDFWLDITGVSVIWDNVMVYGNKWKDWIQYFFSIWWLLKWETFERLIERKWNNILSVYNLNNKDYVITNSWKRYDLYQVSWYDKARMYSWIKDGARSQDKFIFDLTYPNIMTSIWEELFIGSVWQIYSYGSKYPWASKSITRDIVYPSWWTNDITCIYSDWDYLYVFAVWNSLTWWNSNILIKVDITQKENKKNTLNPWFLITTPFYGRRFSDIKKAISIKTWYKLENSTQINIYYRVDKNTNYANFYIYKTNLGSYTTAPEVWATYSDGTRTYTVYDTTETWLWLIIHCEWDEWTFSWTLTKTDWVWDSSFTFDRAYYWFKLITKLSTNDDIDKPTYFDDAFNEIEFMFDLITTNSSNTPYLYDFTFFNEVINE